MRPEERSSLLRDKAGWRAKLLKARAALGDEARREASETIRQQLLDMPALRSAQVVFCFISHGTEVDTHPLLHTLEEAGKTLLVPKIIGREKMIAVPLHDWADLAPGQLGIPTPAASEEWPGRVDFCVTPGIGFTSGGKRLGFGRGYYDQWFATHPAALRVAVAFDCQLVADLPTADHDIPVNVVVTERQVISVQACGPSGRGGEPLAAT